MRHTSGITQIAQDKAYTFRVDVQMYFGDRAEACAVDRRKWKWFHYYWNLCKHFGRECYRTWRWELFASVLVGGFSAILTCGWNDFRTALLSTGLTLGCFVVWHLLRI